MHHLVFFLFYLSLQVNLEFSVWGHGLVNKWSVDLELFSSFCFTPDLIWTLCPAPSLGQPRRHRVVVLRSPLSHCSFHRFSKENRNRGGRILLAGGFVLWAQPGECAEQGEVKGKAWGRAVPRLCPLGRLWWPVPSCHRVPLVPGAQGPPLEASVTRKEIHSRKSVPPGPDPTCFSEPLCCFGPENAI